MTNSRIESAKQTILPLLCQTYGIGAPLIDHFAKLAAESEDRGWLLACSDSKNPGGPILSVDLCGLLASVKAGGLDR